LILKLHETSVVNSSSLLLKDHHQNAGHEIDQRVPLRPVAPLRFLSRSAGPETVAASRQPPSHPATAVCGRKLELHGSLVWLKKPRRFASFLQELHRNEWMVYAKKPFRGPEYVSQDLARYTHRVANLKVRRVSDGILLAGRK
jgi:hypothetical protein